MTAPQKRIEEIEHRLAELPRGTLTYKHISGKLQPYLQRTVEGKSRSYYIKTSERTKVLQEIEERNELIKEKEYLLAYYEKLKSILKANPYLDRRIGIGYQDFDEMRRLDLFYVDKTEFIREWWESPSQVTLITRPRRFGKTLMMKTVETFFSAENEAHPEYFEKLNIWKHGKYRKLYGSIPVIMLSLGGAKGGGYEAAMHSVVRTLYRCCSKYDLLKDSPYLSENQKNIFTRELNSLAEDRDEYAASALNTLCELLTRHYGTKPIIILDEYDTPLMEAFAEDYGPEMMKFCRRFFHETFKENTYYQKALITGVTRVSKNSLFSDLNNIEVCTGTDCKYQTAFGFTEQEVMDALQCQNIDDPAKVKEMYNGFIFGNIKDIYNPWSICCFMKERNFRSYWINTSSNDLIGQLIRRHPKKLKTEMEILLEGGSLHKKINENIVFQYMDGDQEAFWSLLLAAGYIKADHVIKEMEYTECDISITNKETLAMFETQILKMFPLGAEVCTEFTDALLAHKIEEMNLALNDITATSMSYFDTGKRPSEKAPENFYHGLVLGLIVILKNRYRIVSNRESGIGRYDIAMIPRNIAADDAFIMEFKVRDERKEQNLEETVAAALAQIEAKHYDADLLADGIPAQRIYKLGLAFEGKEALIGC